MDFGERTACGTRVSRRTFLAGAAGALTIASTAAAGAKPSRPRRVLWIMIDSLRADHLGYMGYGRATSPWLDNLAAHSANFRFTIAPADHTKRSVASAFTGKRYTELFTEPRRARGMPRNRQTIADTFREAGYRTLAWSANTHVSRDRGFDQGFETFREVLPKGELRATIDQLTEDISQSYNRGPEPEFIYVHTMDVHLPYHPPQPYGTMFSEGRTSRRVQNGVILDDRGDYLTSNLPYFSEDHGSSDNDIQVLIDHYDGAIRYTDERMPVLLDALRHDADEDLLVISGDHGEQFYERGFWNHGKSTHIEEIHVPLLLHGPGVVPGVPEAPVSLYDLYPTFCDLLGLAPPESMSGMSLAPALRGNSLPDRPWVLAEGDDNRGESACLIGKGYAYYVNANITRQQPWRICPYAHALYDLREDPMCTRDIAEERPEVAARMNGVLRLLSPRFAPFTPEVLRLKDDDIELREDLVAPETWRAATSATGGIAEINGAHRVECAVPVQASRIHVVRVPYTLRQGALQMELVGTDGRTVWSYECLKPCPERRALQAAFSSGKTSALTLRIQSSGATIASLWKPEIRRAMVPYVPVGPSGDADAEAPRPAGEEKAPSAEELERMKALGYLE